MPVDTAQPCSHRSRSSEVSFDVRVCMERNDEGTMNPERDQLEPPSARTGFETLEQQCLPNWETGRTTAADYLPVGVGSKFEGNPFSVVKAAVGMRADSEITTPSTASNTVFLQAANLKRRRQPAKKTRNSTPRWERRGATAFESGCTGILLFFFLGEPWPWVPAACAL